MPGPNNIPLGVLAYYTASISPTAPKGTTAKWSVIEPGRKPRSLGKALTLAYVAQRHLVGQTIKVRSLLTESGSKPFDIEATIAAHEPVLPPTQPVRAVLARSWTKDARLQGASIQGGPDFVVGRPQPFSWTDEDTKKKHRNRGLALAAADSQFFYSPNDHSDLGHWAEVFACSTEVEGGGAFEALNTYDKASFTFGLIQFGAHTYNDNFHLLLRKAFQTFPVEAGRYFPELRLHANGIDFEGLVDADKGTWQGLTQKSVLDNLALQRFIKPVPEEVTASEVLFAARMIHWTRAQPGLRRIMVEMAVRRARGNFRDVADALDGMGIAVCAAVFDIRVQGRGSLKKIEAALGESAPLDALLKITKGTKGEKQRLKHLRDAIDRRFKDSKVTYDAKTGELV